MPINPPQINPTKRKSDDIDLRNSSYFKICAIVRQLRPKFIQMNAAFDSWQDLLLSIINNVLGTPNFRECQAANEIRKKMMRVMNLYKRMQKEGRKPPKIEISAAPPQHLSTGKKPKMKHLGGSQKEKPQQKCHQNILTGETSEGKKASYDQITLAKKKEDDVVQSRGSYVVGGSISGWNFITFINRRPPDYYGQSKDSFRLGRELHIEI